MCRGGLVTLPQFYMAAFGNSEHSRAAGLSLNAAGDQLSYADPGDGLGVPRQRINLPTGYAPLPPFETQIRKLRWDQANGRPAVSELLSSDQEDRIKQLFVMRGELVKPFPESHIRKAAGIAAERPPVAVAPPPLAPSPPPTVEQPSPTTSVFAPQPKNPVKQATHIPAFVLISVSVFLIAVIILAYLEVLFQPISLAVLGISVVGAGIPFSQTSTYILAKASYLNSREQPLSALESVEDHNSAKPHTRIDQLELSIKPNTLSAPVVSGLIERMERYKTPSDIVDVLRFALHLKRGDKRAAHYVVGKINSVVAKQIVHTIQARSDLEAKLVAVETEEAEEIERELERLESLSQCERMIEMGELAPSGLGSCQLAQVIWWFLPISKPEKLLGAVVRGATTRAAAVIANRVPLSKSGSHDLNLEPI